MQQHQLLKDSYRHSSRSDQSPSRKEQPNKGQMDVFPIGVFPTSGIKRDLVLIRSKHIMSTPANDYTDEKVLEQKSKLNLMVSLSSSFQLVVSLFTLFTF